jgi:hypothetical protein
MRVPRAALPALPGKAALAPGHREAVLKRELARETAGPAQGRREAVLKRELAREMAGPAQGLAEPRPAAETRPAMARREAVDSPATTIAGAMTQTTSWARRAAPTANAARTSAVMRTASAVGQCARTRINGPSAAVLLAASTARTAAPAPRVKAATAADSRATAVARAEPAAAPCVANDRRAKSSLSASPERLQLNPPGFAGPQHFEHWCRELVKALLELGRCKLGTSIEPPDENLEQRASHVANGGVQSGTCGC